MNNPLSKLSSRRSYAYLAVIVVSIMILSGLAGIIPVNVTQGNGSQNQKVQPAAGSDEILSFFETGIGTRGSE